MPGIIFTTAPPFNQHTGKYSWDNWNKGLAKGDPTDLRNIKILCEGNFYTFMRHLLGFVQNPDPESKDIWVSRRSLMKKS